MIQKAVVKKIIDTKIAEIEVQRQGACAHDCSECGGCGGSATERIKAVAINQVNAEIGETVTVEGENKKIMGIAAIVYVVPIILFFAIYAICSITFDNSTISAIGGILGFVIGIISAILYNNKMKKENTIPFTIIKRG